MDRVTRRKKVGSRKTAGTAKNEGLVRDRRKGGGMKRGVGVGRSRMGPKVERECQRSRSKREGGGVVEENSEQCTVNVER